METEDRVWERNACRDLVGIGRQAPSDSWIDQEGKETSLLDYRGRTVVLAFFRAEWDPARTHLISYLNQALSTLPERVRIVGDSREVNHLAVEIGESEIARIPVLQCLDSHGPVADQFQVDGRDAVFIIGPEGQVLHRLVSSGSLPT